MIRYQLYKGQVRYKEYHYNREYEYPQLVKVTYYIR